MPKIRKQFKNRFTTVSNDFLYDKELGMKERGLLITMLSLPDDWEFSTVGLAAILPNGKNGIGAVLKRLEELGYLRRNRIYKNGKIIDWLYVFSDSKLSDEELLHPQNEDLGFEDIDNEDIENEDLQNEAQLITKESITNKEIKNIEKKQESRNESNHLIDYEGMKLTDKQYGELERLIKDTFNYRIDSCKGNIIQYVKKLYDQDTGKFYRPNGEEIKTIYGYVRSNFAIKSQKDQLLKQQQLQNDGYEYSGINYF